MSFPECQPSSLGQFFQLRVLFLAHLGPDGLVPQRALFRRFLSMIADLPLLSLRRCNHVDSISYSAVTQKRASRRVLPFIVSLFNWLPHGIRAVLCSNPPRGDV